MLIQKIIDFDRKNLTSWKLIFSKHRIGMLFLSCFLLFLALVAFLLFLFTTLNKLDFSLLLLIPIVVFTYLSIRISKNETLRVLKIHYERDYELCLNSAWNYTTVEEVHWKKLQRFLVKQNIDLNNFDIPFIIDSLKFERQHNQYVSIVWNIVIPLLTGLFGAFIATVFNLTESYTVFLKYLAIFIGVVIAIGLMVFIMEQSIVKPLVLKRKNKYKRIIRALENIYLYITADKGGGLKT